MDFQTIRSKTSLVVCGYFLGLVLLPSIATAHCDSLDGPVVRDARIALETRDATPVLKWITQEHEAEVVSVFEKSLAVRGKGDTARELADQHFFETLVRLHRAGEGEPFTGLKPTGSTEPGIAAADAALAAGSGAELARALSAAIENGVNERFATARERQRHAGDSVEAGRDYVEAYVDYVHFVETVESLATHGTPPVHHE
ncbi:MAG TPA: DUF6448 family protein [Gammaproteobacteria bacterium]